MWLIRPCDSPCSRDSSYGNATARLPLARDLTGNAACRQTAWSTLTGERRKQKTLSTWTQQVLSPTVTDVGPAASQGWGVMYLQPAGGAPGVLQTVIPEALRREVLEDLHEGAVGGHLGVDKTIGRLRERFYWPAHFNDMQEWCHNCGVCQTRKSPAPKARAPLKSIVTGYSLQLVATDIVGPMPESAGGNRYILVVSDYFTRYVEAYPIPDQEATTVAHRLVDEFFLRFSPPEQLHSDQRRNFESSVVAEACRLLGIEKSRTTPYYPQSDGLVEKFNRTLLDMLATAVIDRPFEWERHLPRLCFTYNTSIHPTTGFSPFTLMFGRQARLPTDVAFGTSPSPAVAVPQYVAQLQESLQFSYARVREQMGHQLQKQKVHYDARTEGDPFEDGDWVWLHHPAVPKGKSRKLHRPWTGPYRVVKRLSEAVYHLQDVQCPRRRPVVHFNRLKRCPDHVRMPQRTRVETQGRPRAGLHHHFLWGAKYSWSTTTHPYLMLQPPHLLPLVE